MSRKDFLKRMGLTAGAAALMLKGIDPTPASAVTFSDNIEAGVTIGPNAPASAKALWVDTSDNGILKYHDGTAWVAAASGKATTMQNARNIQTNLNSTQAAPFDGSANVTPGVTGTLPVANGGTGATTAEGSLKNIGALRQSNGVPQYWNGSSWVNCKSVWG